MKSSFSYKIQLWLLVITGILVSSVLLFLWKVPNNDLEESRNQDYYEAVQQVEETRIEDPSAALGLIREFRFTVDPDLIHDTTLAFQFSHQNAEVYLGEERVYALHVSDAVSMIKTPGVNWAMIPLYREDAGKQVRVLLEPVYENYQNRKVHFLIGSALAIYKAELAMSFPEMALSVIDVLAGIFLLAAAVFFSIREKKEVGFYSLAMLAVSLGLWNFTQTDFVPLLLKEKTIFLYYTSLLMLMICVVPLLKSVKKKRDQHWSSQLLDSSCILCCLSGIVQMILQMLGILDLREMLSVTHGLIAVSSVILICSGMLEWKNEKKLSGVWLLGAGTLIDMCIYYAEGSSAKLLFVLIAILCYVLLEGIGMFFTYMRQKQMLEEKEIQLTLSRITTMMSQIRSHFVFNILNAISGMCKYDPEKADETVVRFSRYLRNNIDILENDKPIRFDTELERLEDYVVLEQVRFGDQIEFYTDVKVDQFLIPPLILQPVVENAIKHGLLKKVDGGTIVLRTWEEDHAVKITIEDDGVGFDLAELKKEKSVGLKNIRYRLYHLMEGTMEIDSQIGAGTTVTITIPKKEEQE